MPRELIIRPGLNDHSVIADLIAPGGAGVLLPRRRSLISRLVLDAHHAPMRPQFAEVAANAGVPFLVDPLTPLLQGPLRAEDRWAQLPFGRIGTVAALDFGEAHDRRVLVEQVVDFQVAQGATAVIPPYPYIADPEDPWFTHALDFVRLTASYMRSKQINLPIVPVLCARRQTFAAEQSWDAGIGRFGAAATDVGADMLAISLSPIGDGKESYHKVLSLFLTVERLSATGIPIIAWRQGLYGPALVAAGLSGYETGIATREQSDMSGTISNRRPPKPGTKAGGGGFSGIYFQALNRSLPSPVAKVLLEHPALGPKVMCDDERCCPDGVSSTVTSHREHAVRCRAKGLAAIAEMPQRSWRLHHIATESDAAVTLAAQANDVLAAAGIKQRVATRGLESLAQVAEHLRQPARSRSGDASGQQ